MYFVKNAFFVKIRGNSSPKIFLDFWTIHIIPNMNLDNFRSSFRKNNGFYDIFEDKLQILKIMLYCNNGQNMNMVPKI